MTGEFWDQRYDSDDFVYGTAPNRWLVTQAPLFRPGGTALAVADGEGRNGVWLAEQGLKVTAIDQSGVGLAKAARLAEERGVDLATIRADLTAWDWPAAAFDLVALIFIHFPPSARPAIHRQVVASLRPGGVAVLEAFHPNQLLYRSGGPPVRDMLYTADDLQADFSPGCDILHLEERLVDLDEGPLHQGTAAVVRMVARRQPGE